MIEWINSGSRNPIVDIDEFEFFGIGELNGIFGLPGAGKTMELVREIKEAYDKGFEIITNVNLNPNYFKKFTLFNPDDSKVFLSQLKDLIKYRTKNKIYHPTFLAIDQFSGILDAQSKVSESKDYNELWINLGKVGITTDHNNQNISMTIKRYRDNMSRYKVVTKNTEDSYIISLFLQTITDHEDYELIYEGIEIQKEEYKNLYNTRQVMYL